MFHYFTDLKHVVLFPECRLWCMVERIVSEVLSRVVCAHYFLVMYINKAYIVAYGQVPECHVKHVVDA